MTKVIFYCDTCHKENNYGDPGESNSGKESVCKKVTLELRSEW